MYRLSLILALLIAPQMLWAQTDPADPLDPGKAAFREERFAAAARLFQQVAEKDPDNAEAQFLLARVYFETPLRDEAKARKAIDKALEIQPDNVEYLVARLMQYRTDSWELRWRTHKGSAAP